MKQIVIVALIILSVWVVDVSAETTTPSATFLVNSSNDNDDGSCNSGHCSLREAIREANLTLAHDTIQFDFTTSTFFNPLTPLPTISRPLTIDGITGTGASCPSAGNAADLKLTINGSFAGSGADGLLLSNGANGSQISGLAIINFDDDGIDINGTDNVHIYCNHIGVAINGTTAAGNEDGIRVRGTAQNIIIGGTTGSPQSERNVISGNDFYGIQIESGGANTVVSGNYIGHAADGGNSALPNSWGVSTSGTGTIIGGANSYEANFIAGNSADGVVVKGPASDIEIDGNTIGRTLLNSALGNGANGILIRDDTISSPVGVEIGLNRPNIITSSGQNGILVHGVPPAPQDITIRYNSIYGNGGLGIDLNNDGVSSNDNGDSDTGANSTQNFPDNIVVENGGRLTATLLGRSSTLDHAYTIDVYINSGCNNPSWGEGFAHHTSFIVTGTGGAINIDRIIDPVPDNRPFVTLTATHNDTGETSEFSRCIEVTPSSFVVDDNSFSGDVTPGDGACKTNSNTCSLLAAVQEVNALGGALGGGPYGISFDVSDDKSTFSFDHKLDITAPVIIDGATNPGAACPTQNSPATLKITLSGQSAPTGSLINLLTGSDGSKIRGLSLIASKADGITIFSDDNVITCNHIGLLPDGTVAANADDGVHVAGGDNNRIGSAGDFADRNVISGNTSAGVQIDTAADNTTISGNYIGLTPFGSGSRPNQHGIFLLGAATNTTIGGTSNVLANRVSANSQDGISIEGNVSMATIQRNQLISNGRAGIRMEDASNIIIGDVPTRDVTGADGNTVSDNGSHGIWLVDSNFVGIFGNDISSSTHTGIRLSKSSDVTISDNDIFGNSQWGIYTSSQSTWVNIQLNRIGTEAEPNTYDGIRLDSGTVNTTVLGNVIQHNMRNGIRVDTGAATNLSQNSIFNNTLLGIDLGNDGVTANDVLSGDPDDDSGANGLQNFPVITSATAAFASHMIEGELTSTPDTTFTVQLFRSSSCDSSSGTHGEGQAYLGETDPITTNGSGKATFTFSPPGPNLFLVGQTITAIALGAEGTSEFSACYTATDPVATSVAIGEWQIADNRPNQTILYALLLLLLTTYILRRPWINNFSKESDR